MSRGPNPLWEALVHQRQAYRILGRIHELFELVERTKYLKCACKVLQGRTWVAVFHAPHCVDGSADTLGQGFLGQMSAAARQSDALPDPVQSPFNVVWDGTSLHELVPKLELHIQIKN